mgnify:FL=1
MRIGLIVAMDKEFVQLRGILSDAEEKTVGRQTFVVGKTGDKEVVLQKCGIGKVNSAIGTVEMIRQYKPDIIISTGCAGGTSTDMEVGDVVIGTEMVYHDAYCGEEQQFGQVMGMPPRYKANPQLVLMAEQVEHGAGVHEGLIVGGDWFVNSREKMQQILGRFPEAVAVDMESTSIAQTCYIYKVPFISFRVISDVPLKDHKASQYYDFWDRMADGSFQVTKCFLEKL